MRKIWILGAAMWLLACQSASIKVDSGDSQEPPADGDTDVADVDSDKPDADSALEADTAEPDTESETVTDSDGDTSLPDGDSQATDLFPANLTFDAFSPHNIALHWDAAASDTTLIIERRTGDTGFVEVGRRPGSRGHFLDVKLIEGTDYYYRIRLCDASRCGEPLLSPKESTPARRIGTFSVDENDPSGLADDQLMITSVVNITKEDKFKYGHIIAIDRTGQIWWEYDTSTKGQTSEIQMMKAGTLLVGLGMQAYEIQQDGTILWAQTEGTAHHDFDELSDGRLIYLSFDIFNHGVGTKWVGDTINILSADRTRVEWSWNARDHISQDEFDAADIADNIYNMGQDWTHGNALVFNEDTNEIFYNSRNLDRIYCLDYPSGVIKYTFGDGGEFGADSFQHAHDPIFMEPHHIMIYDNGKYIRFWSRVLEFTFDPDAKSYTELWEYREDHWFGLGLGSALPLDSGNILVTDGYGGRLFEITHDTDAQKLWQISFESGWQLYKTVIVPNTYFSEW